MKNFPCSGATCVIATAALVTAVQSAPSFTPVQPDLLAAGASFTNAWADFDNDGNVDLFVGFNGEPNRLYRIQNGMLTDVAATMGVADARATRAVAWGDYDADGDPDLLVGFTPGTASLLRVYRNDRTRFADVTEQLGLSVTTGAIRQPVWIDFDADGDLDLFVAFRDRANAMYRNDVGKFLDVAGAVGLDDTRKTVGAVWFDYDEDDDLDLYTGNMDGDANALFRNDPGKFSDVAVAAGVAWAGREPAVTTNGTVRPCVADVNNDGHLDIFAANYGKNGLLLNRGGGRFEDASSQWAVDIDSRYDSCAFSDFDNDGRIDLYVNGTVTGGTSYPDHLLRNTGTRFETVTPSNITALQADHGVQWGDFDKDGDEDLALTGSRPDGMHSLMRNTLSDAAAARSLRVRVVNAAGHSVAAGAEVRVFAAGTSRLLGMRIVDSGSGYDSQNDMAVHFGLPASDPVDVEVVCPGAGKRTSVRTAGVRINEWRGRQLVVKVSR